MVSVLWLWFRCCNLEFVGSSRFLCVCRNAAWHFGEEIRIPERIGWEGSKISSHSSPVQQGHLKLSQISLTHSPKFGTWLSRAFLVLLQTPSTQIPSQFFWIFQDWQGQRRTIPTNFANWGFPVAKNPSPSIPASSKKKKNKTPEHPNFDRQSLSLKYSTSKPNRNFFFPPF